MDTTPASVSGWSEESKVLYINELPTDTHFENTELFFMLLKDYYNTEPTREEIYKTLRSAAVFTKFYDFIVKHIAQQKIIIKKELVDVFRE